MAEPPRKRAELDRSETRARRASEQISALLACHELVSVLAHELNQPLAAIVTNANAAKRWLALEPPDLVEASEGLQRIDGEGKRASQIAERVRQQLQIRPLRAERVRVSDALEELSTWLQEESSALGVTVRVEASIELPPVRCDSLRLQQVLLNLTRNALEALADSQRRPRLLELTAEQLDTTEVCLHVTDSGPGLPSDRESAFEPFFSTKHEHLGLGLNVCRTLLDALGGRLWATANASGGETFSFTLPIAAVAT